MRSRPRLASAALGRLASFLVALAGLALLAAAQGRASNRADYRIHARLDGETKKIDGDLTLRWTNRSGESVRDLWFHLYLNAFSNNRSTHLTESEGKLRGKEIDAGWGWSRIKTIVVDEADGGGFQDALPSLRYERPDDGNEEDRTVFRVELPQPLASGVTVSVKIEWEAQLPRVRRRTGFKDDFLLVAQWFPKLGVYEAGRGWNCHQFHMNTEFFSDYGTYDVTLDLPIEYEGKIGASGVKVVDTPKGDRIEVTFAAPSPGDQRREDAFGKNALVHDFTWTADTRYVYPAYRQTFRFKEWAERFPDEVEKARTIFGEEPRLRDVDVTVLIHPEHLAQAERHFRAACAALFFYGLWFGEYPYEHITVVDPAFGAAAGGMEYPTLFTCGSRLFASEDMHTPEGVAVHECGHQFWYGLVGNNEFEAAWLDEGFNTYTDSEVLHRVYGLQRGTTTYSGVPVDGERVADPPGGGALGDALAARELRVPFTEKKKLRFLVPSGALDYWRDQPLFTFVPEWTDTRRSDRVGYLSDPDTDPIETAGWKYADRASYGTNSYPRTGVALRTLQGLVGDEAFYRGMRHFAREFRYQHPYPADFYRSFQQGAGLSLDWYFRELFQGTGTVDWSVSVEQARRAEPRGFFQGEGGEFLERAKKEPVEGEPPKTPYHVKVELRRKGELTLPLPVRFVYEDGAQEEKVWTRDEQESATWKRFEFESEKKLKSVQIDPQRGYYIDRDLSNNDWYDETEGVSPWRWTERVLAQYQNALHFLQGLGG